MHADQNSLLDLLGYHMFIDHIILLQHVIDKILNLMNFLEIMVTVVNKCTASVFSDS